MYIIWRIVNFGHFESGWLCLCSGPGRTVGIGTKKNGREFE
jgi:hypothetical protein